MSHTLDQDWICIQKIRDGDKFAFNEIFNRHKNLAVNIAYRFTHSREAAEDVAQDVFIKVYEGKVKVDPNAKFTTWLYRVTVNTALDVMKRKKFEPLHDQMEGPGNSPQQLLGEDEIKNLVQSGIARLPEKFRSPILLYQFEGLSYREIAQILGISEKAVERRLYHAKQILKELFAANLGGFV